MPDPADTGPPTSSWPSSKTSDYADLPATSPAATSGSSHDIGITRTSA
jgi:hypothetical protein